MEINELKQQLNQTWRSEGYSEGTINSVFEFIESGVTHGSDDWVKVPDVNFLICVKHLTDSMWHNSFDEPFYNQLVKDIESGITFAFYIENGLLGWER